VKWLVDQGIDRSRLRSAGLGLERPIASNDDPVGRQQNRRVEFHIKQLETGKSASDDEADEDDDDESSEEEEEESEEPSDDDGLGADPASW